MRINVQGKQGKRRARSCRMHKKNEICWREAESIQLWPHYEKLNMNVYPSVNVICRKIGCKFIQLKFFVIAVRRGRTEYWKPFRTFIRSNLDFFCENSNNRWLISILDSYSDHGTREE